MGLVSFDFGLTTVSSCFLIWLETVRDHSPCPIKSPGAGPGPSLGRKHDVTKAAILSAIEQAEKAKREMWERIREIELSEAELKTLSDEAPIFRIYRGVVTLDRAVKELSHPDLVLKIATIVWKLAERVRQVENRSAGADTGKEAA